MVLRIGMLVAIVAGFVLLWLKVGRSHPCRRCHHPIPHNETRCPNCGWTMTRRS
jgi:predicted amidophosphoribosyltransferase